MGEERAETRAQLLRKVADTVVSTAGDLEPGLRAAILHTARGGGELGPDVAPPLAAFVDKVIERAYTVTDADVDALRAAGLSEDAIFEAVVATAVGAGLARLDRAWPPWPGRSETVRLACVSDGYDRSSVPPGMNPSDMRKLLLYRSNVFGDAVSAAFQELLRGPSEWSVGQRELMAAYVSAQNQCPF